MTTEFKTRIETCLRQEVAPALAMEGLEIEVVDFENGIASIRFNGVCSSCPGTLIPLLTGLQQELQQHIPEVEYLDLVP